MQEKIARGYLKNVVDNAVREYIDYLTREGVMHGNAMVVTNDLSQFISDDIIKYVPNILDSIGELDDKHNQQSPEI